MLVHVVLYKLKTGVTEEQTQTLLAEARRRLAAIPGVQNLKAGTSIYPDEAYQCGLVMDLPDVAGLEQYRVHPIHVAFVEEVVKPLVDEIKRFDYVDD